MSKQILRFLFGIPWLPLIVGAALGAVVALAAETWSREGSQQPNGALQLAIGLLLGGIVGWVIPEFVNHMRLLWKTALPIRTLLDPFHKDSDVISLFIASLYSETCEFQKAVPLKIKETDHVVPHYGIPWVLTEGDALALAYVMAILARAGRTSNISIMRDDCAIDLNETNIICIGSPKSNFKSRLINNAFKRPPIQFGIENDRQVICESGRPRWRADETFDYGVLAKLANEYDATKAVMILAGISYVGTTGVGYYLWKHWREIESSAQGRYFCMVLKVRRDNYQCVEKEWEYIFLEGPR